MKTSFGLAANGKRKAGTHDASAKCEMAALSSKKSMSIKAGVSDFVAEGPIAARSVLI